MKYKKVIFVSLYILHVWNKNQLLKCPQTQSWNIFYIDFFYNCIPKSKANVLINSKQKEILCLMNFDKVLLFRIMLLRFLYALKSSKRYRPSNSRLAKQIRGLTGVIINTQTTFLRHALIIILCHIPVFHPFSWL